MVLPLSQNVLDSERYGTRHRAAIGISEQTDALVVVVSEETGSISLVQRGRIERNLTEEQLRRRIFNLIRPQAPRRACRCCGGRWTAPGRSGPDAEPEAKPIDPEARVVTPAPRGRPSGRGAPTLPMGSLLRNWHLKLAALRLATILYTGFVFSGSFTDRLSGPADRGHQPAQ